jgi:DNA-binding transcriptional regulator YhcF (GntR family)
MTMTTGTHAALADVALDRAGEVPIGVQLAWALRARIADGRLATGERLPGLREIAEALGINANTARSVYQRLEQDGLIESRQGTGTFVSGGDGERSAAAGRIAAAAARRAQTTGVDPREVAAALYVASPRSPRSPQSQRSPRAERTAERTAARTLVRGSARVERTAARTPGRDTSPSADRERRRQLMDQIAALEQTLSELQTRHPGVIPMPAAPRRAGPRLLSVEDLEDVRMELVRRLAEAEPLLLEARRLEREALAARRAQVAQTAAENARARANAERRSIAKEQRPKRPAGRRPSGPRTTGTRTTRPGPSAA